MGASIFKKPCLIPFHADMKKPEALKNSTGSDKARFSQVKVSLNPDCSIIPEEKYSGKLSIMILAKQKPATPILYILFLLKEKDLFLLLSFRLISGSYPMKANNSTTFRKDICLGSEMMNTSFR